MLEHIESEWGKIWVSSQTHMHRGVFVPNIYVDINDGKHVDAKLFAQIVHWHQVNPETGRSRLRVQRDKHFWLAKKHADWEEETRIKPGTVRKCLERLKERGLIYYELYGFAGVPTPHIRVNWQEFERRIRAVEAGVSLNPPVPTEQMGCKNEQGAVPTEQAICPNRTGHLSQQRRSNTKIPTKTTAKKTPKNPVNESAWMKGPVPIPRLLLLPPPKVDATEAIQFFEKNIDAVNPHLREVIGAACSQYGLTAVLNALQYAAEHKAKRWAYVQTRLEGQAQAQAERVAREAAHQAVMAESATCGCSGKSDDFPTRSESQNVPAVVEALAVVCPGHGGTAAKTWDTVQYLLESQLDRGTFNTYVRDLVLTDYQAETVTFVVAAKSGHVRDVCAHRLGRHIRKLLGEVCEQDVQVEFIFEQVERGAA